MGSIVEGVKGIGSRPCRPEREIQRQHRATERDPLTAGREAERGRKQLTVTLAVPGPALSTQLWDKKIAWLTRSVQKAFPVQPAETLRAALRGGAGGGGAVRARGGGDVSLSEESGSRWETACLYVPGVCV